MIDIDPIPYGYCHCGCGQKAGLTKDTRLSRNQVKGEPTHFIKGHNKRTLVVSSDGTISCKNCKQVKLLCDFTKNKRTRLGYIAICKTCQSYHMRERRSASPEETRIICTLARLRAVGVSITKEEYQSLELRHAGLCAICNQSETKQSEKRTKSLAVDHDHKTMRIRGLLCFRCNAMLGLCKDDCSVLHSAILYLEYHRSSV